jgi:hypothetical protein
MSQGSGTIPRAQWAPQAPAQPGCDCPPVALGGHITGAYPDQGYLVEPVVGAQQAYLTAALDERATNPFITEPPIVVSDSLVFNVSKAINDFVGVDDVVVVELSQLGAPGAIPGLAIPGRVRAAQATTTSNSIEFTVGS